MGVGRAVCFAQAAARRQQHALPEARKHSAVIRHPTLVEPIQEQRRLGRVENLRELTTAAARWIHAAHSLAAAVAGQVTVIAVAPRCSSMRISATGVAAARGGRLTGTNNGLTSGTCMPRAGAYQGRCPVASAQPGGPNWRSRLALTPWAIARAAIDMPGCMQLATASALNSSLCRRRRRFGLPC